MMNCPVAVGDVDVNVKLDGDVVAMCNAVY
jgi:hypothetical protein